MPLSGSDVASKPSGTTAVANTTIESAKYNSVIDDIYNILNTVRTIAKGFTGASTAQGAVDNFFLAGTTVDDDALLLVDPADATKKVRLDAGGITAGQTRVLTAPDASTTLVGTDTTQTLSNKTFTGLDASTTAKGLIEVATAAEYRTGTDAERALTAGQVKDAMAEVTLTDAATIAWDMSTGIDFTVTLGGNRTLGNPTNVVVGRRGRIRVVQDATGSRTLTKSSNHKTIGGAALTIASAADAVTYLDYDAVSATIIRLSNSPLAWS